MLLGVLFTTQLVLSGRLSWQQAIPTSVAEWLPWMILSPLLFWVAGRFSLERGKLLKGILINLLAALATIFLAETIFQSVDKAFQSPQESTMARPGELRPGPGVGPGGLRPRDRPEGDFAGPDGAGPRRLPPPRMLRNGPRSGSAQHLIHFHIPLCLFTVMAAHAFAYFQRFQDKERKAVELAASLAEARLLALQMQMQPHFLFNALNAMSTLVHSNPQAADDMITNLSELLRRTLTVGRKREVPLAEELDYVQSYLEIERVRFGNQLEVDWQIEPATRDALVPVLCLQAIVENAVRHGIERRMCEVGRIGIAARKTGTDLQITVTDNGPGLTAGETKPRGHGVGLGNSRSRLKTLYGEAAALELTNEPAGGCRATVTLPFHLTAGTPL